MDRTEIRLERLLNRRVVDPDGRALGPLEEVRIEERDGEAFVVEYRVGAFAVLQRLAGSSFRQSLLRSIGLAQKRGTYVVPWEQMDLCDPLRPRLRCAAATLRRADD